VSRVCAGDSVAFEELYEAYRDRVYGYIVRRIRDRAEAEDLTQETFAQAYRSMASFEGRSSLLTWLIGIARFVCLRFHRFSSRWMIGSEPGPIRRDYRVDDPVEERVDAIRALERCEAFLAEAYGEPNRSIFRLRYGDSRSIRSIASEVGKSEDAVKACLRRSRLALERQRCEFENGPSPWLPQRA
jgi:RNA polymerase sigma-70 factor (ECF subfamily)